MTLFVKMRIQRSTENLIYNYDAMGIDTYCQYLKIDFTQERVISQHGVSEQSGPIQRLQGMPFQKQKKKHRNNSYF